MKLGRVTVLLGPPAVGKSNLLEAIALATYFDRYAFYEDVESLSRLVRVADIRHLFTRYMSMDIEINLGSDEWRRSLRISIWERPDLVLNDTRVPITECHSHCLFTYNGRQYQADLSKAKELLKVSENVLARLYGFDRFRDHIVNSMVNGVEVEAPQELLREDGKNFGVVAMTQPEMLRDLNAELKEFSQVEVRLLDDGRVVMLNDVVATKPPESLLRVLYYLVALSSSSDYIKLHGLENKAVVLLEEPETHPKFLHLLVKYITKFSEVGYVVITTHNPILVSLLRDKLDVTLYYVYRGGEGLTEVVELDKDKLAEELVTSEDILFMKPNEVLRFAKL